MCGLMSDLVVCKFRKVWSYMTPNVLTETRSHKKNIYIYTIERYRCGRKSETKLSSNKDEPITWIFVVFYYRTYVLFMYVQVIPLSQRSGLLEWCEGTIPLGEYLINPSTGAHRRYRPSDLKAHECRKYMAVSMICTSHAIEG